MVVETQIQQVHSMILIHKWIKTLYGLAVAELVLACIQFLFSIIDLGIVGSQIQDLPKAIGFASPGFFVAIIGMVSGGLGIGALRGLGVRRRCMVVSHFIMCIFAAVFDFGAVFAWIQVAIEAGFLGFGGIAFVSWVLVVSVIAHSK